MNTISSGVAAGANSGAILWNVNVNTAASGGILKIYNATSASAPDLLAQIDCSQMGSFWYGLYCPKGIFYDLSVSTPDVTIGTA